MTLLTLPAIAELLLRSGPSRFALFRADCLLSGPSALSTGARPLCGAIHRLLVPRLFYSV
jgi:hypothetical protein